MTLGWRELPWGVGSEARADADKHRITEGSRLASVQAGLEWLQPVPTGNLQWMLTCALPRKALPPPPPWQEGGWVALPSDSWN